MKLNFKLIFLFIFCTAISAYSADEMFELSIGIEGKSGFACPNASIKDNTSIEVTKEEKTFLYGGLLTLEAIFRKGNFDTFGFVFAAGYRHYTIKTELNYGYRRHYETNMWYIALGGRWRPFYQALRNYHLFSFIGVGIEFQDHFQSTVISETLTLENNQEDILEDFRFGCYPELGFGYHLRETIKLQATVKYYISIEDYTPSIFQLRPYFLEFSLGVVFILLES